MEINALYLFPFFGRPLTRLGLARRQQIRSKVPVAYIMADRTIEEAVSRILAAELGVEGKAIDSGMPAIAMAA
jgi:hypothetical protein